MVNTAESALMMASIVDIVEKRGPIKGTELMPLMLENFFDNNKVEALNSDEYMEAIDALVESGEIIEVEYVLPQMSYRVKSMYFPKGTQLNIVELEQ